MNTDRLPPTARTLLLPVVVLLLVFGLPWLIQPIAKALLVLFAGILFAIFLHALTLLLCKAISMPHWLAWALVLLVLVLSVAGFGYLVGYRIADQMGELTERLPEALETLRSKIPLERWFGQIDSESVGSIGGGFLEKIAGFFATFFASFTYFFIIFVLGIYISFNPRLYMDSLIALLPKRSRPRGEEVLQNLGHVMRWWLVGQLSAMAVVGGLTTVGLYIIGEPLALVLGFIAGLLSFIPFLGPFLSVIPAFLVGLSRSPTMGLYVILVFIVVQQIESNLITPIIQRKAVMLPPAYLIAVQFLAGILIGFYGVLLAAPMAVLITVLIQMLYIQDVLGDEVQLLGDHG